ncbi:ATP-binding protein [Streptomyces sp. NBC_00237]|uniref:AAA family ATPase n=1 Tax=Streptomyces sp. NBC_00237 TaxID=2975687 RepID=UPI002257A897|nr:AAA family ATPase [Streptomyces sp. NBC_00237]MCX5201056.1 ATP-binding protein [Streptomyces sp. NBC_00237]
MLYVITGPPAAGKSSWVTSHAKATDIVIDLDVITRALTGPGAPQWNHDPVVSKVALRARYAAIDEAVKHRDTTDVYLIHTMPSPRWKAKYRRWDAKEIVVDPGRDVVTQRVRDMRQPALEAVVTRWYTQQRKGGSRAITPQSSRAW